MTLTQFSKLTQCEEETLFEITLIVNHGNFVSSETEENLQNHNVLFNILNES